MIRRDTRSLSKCALAFAVAAALSTACTPSSPHSSAALPAVPMRVRNTSTPIKHVVLVIQENRSFENLFAGYPNANAPTSGKMLIPVNGKYRARTVQLEPIPLNDSLGDMGHSFHSAVHSWDHGAMDRFNHNTLTASGQPAGRYPYSYVRRADIRPYWTMAQHYVLADDMFPTEWGPSFTAHQDLIAGATALSSTTSVADNPTNDPWGCDDLAGSYTKVVTKPAGGAGPGTVSSPGPFPCYNYVSLARPLDRAHVSWRYYAPAVKQSNPSETLWSAFDAIHYVRYGPDWKNDVISPPSKFLTDVASGKLASMTWIVPDYLNSDHPAAKSATGPSWVASVVNAVGKSPFWNSTAVIVLWDDWGGWYDNVPPPQLDYTGLGIRVPCIIVSAYPVKPGYVDHTQYEYGSILKFVEQTFGLSSMGTSDARATSIVDSFDFTQPPRGFTPIAQRYPASFFVTQKPSYQPPDSE
jgi:phospholipase C